MIFIRHLLGFLYPDIFRQKMIQGYGNLLRGNPGICVKHGYITHRMDAGICPAGAGHLSFLSQKAAQRLFQFLLHRHGIFLNLPAAVAGAVIGNGQSDPFHHTLHFYILK